MELDWIHLLMKIKDLLCIDLQGYELKFRKLFKKYSITSTYINGSTFKELDKFLNLDILKDFQNLMLYL